MFKRSKLYFLARRFAPNVEAKLELVLGSSERIQIDLATNIHQPLSQSPFFAMSEWGNIR